GLLQHTSGTLIGSISRLLCSLGSGQSFFCQTISFIGTLLYSAHFCLSFFGLGYCFIDALVSCILLLCRGAGTTSCQNSRQQYRSQRYITNHEITSNRFILSSPKFRPNIHSAGYSGFAGKSKVKS